MTQPSVAVIGAGLAGLSCATALQQAGVSVRVFDKSRGVGGRMSTRRGDDWACDHGAQYFTARDPEFHAEVQRWQAAGVATRWNPRLVVLGGDAEHHLDPTLERFVGVPRMTAPPRHLAATLDVALAHTVQRLERRATGWHLATAETGWLDAGFDRLVVALPAPQATVLLESAMPALAAVASSVHMRGCWAVMLHYAAPVGLPFDAAFVNRGPLRWVTRNGSKPGREGRETWLLHATAEWSEARLEETPEAVAQVLIEEFRRLRGAPPDAWSAHRWRYAEADPSLRRGCAWDADAAVGLCGDWLDEGKVEGAWRSGRTLARQMLNEADDSQQVGE